MKNRIDPNELFLATKLFLYEDTKPFVLKAKEFPNYDQFVNQVLLDKQNNHHIIEWRPVRAIVHVSNHVSLDKQELEKIHSLGDVQDYLNKQYQSGKLNSGELSHIDFEISVDSQWKEKTRNSLHSYIRELIANPNPDNLSFDKQLHFLNTYLQQHSDEYFPTEYSLDQKSLNDLIAKHRHSSSTTQLFQFNELLLALWFSDMISILQTNVKTDSSGTYYTADIELAEMPNNSEYFYYSQLRLAFNLSLSGPKQIGVPYLDKNDQLIVYKIDGTAISVDFSQAEKSMRILKTFFELSKDPNSNGLYSNKQVSDKYTELFGAPKDHLDITQDKTNAWKKIRDKEPLNTLIEWRYDKAPEKWVFKINKLEE